VNSGKAGGFTVLLALLAADVPGPENAPQEAVPGARPDAEDRGAASSTSINAVALLAQAVPEASMQEPASSSLNDAVPSVKREPNTTLRQRRRSVSPAAGEVEGREDKSASMQGVVAAAPQVSAGDWLINSAPVWQVAEPVPGTAAAQVAAETTGNETGGTKPAADVAIPAESDQQWQMRDSDDHANTDEQANPPVAGWQAATPAFEPQAAGKTEVAAIEALPRELNELTPATDGLLPTPGWTPASMPKPSTGLQAMPSLAPESHLQASPDGVASATSAAPAVSGPAGWWNSLPAAPGNLQVSVAQVEKEPTLTCKQQPPAPMGAVERVLASASPVWQLQGTMQLRETVAADRQEETQTTSAHQEQRERAPVVVEQSAFIQNSGAEPAPNPGPAADTIPAMEASPIKPAVPDHPELAFTMRLTPRQAPGSPVSKTPADTDTSGSHVAAPREDSVRAIQEPVTRATRAHKPDEPPAHTDSEPLPGAKAVSQAPSEAGTPQRTSPEPTRPETPSVQSSEPAPLEAVLPSKAATPAQHIKLEVTGGEHRVEVRLTERAGEVRVAVRTTDSQLAGSLRQNLPGLSARLDAGGYRTESWHPAAASGEERRTADTNTGTLTQDSNPQSGQHGQQQQSGNGNSRRAETPEEQHERKEKGKDFAWLMSSLQ
jgi:hypothetical protein